MDFFSSKIIKWYSQHKRELPWRNTKDPYKIWLSEIILQQTQVKQGLPYYQKFIKTFPSVSELANANEEQVLKLWQGLGYYSRARNLHFAAKQIQQAGFFPKEYKDIIRLKGVGEYTAAAIASFAFKLPYAVVDGNVFRLLSRFYGIDTPIDTSRGKKEFSEIAQTLLIKEDADTHNQAIMEFGSQMCKPKQPNCNSCPLKDECVAFANNTTHLLPVKKGKVKVKTVFFEYFFFKMNGYTLVNKRADDGIWQNMYEFPLITFDELKSTEEILNHNQFDSWMKDIDFSIESISEFKHILSHRKINARFWEIKCQKTLPASNFKKIKIETIDKLAVSRLIEKFIQAKI
ncbi:MAG: A/G-specific adenine glycosylase [Flavobacteriales bacterium]|nr:A/G-specific adenine glycosylase [Flavobacteriales bacterium]